MLEAEAHGNGLAKKTGFASAYFFSSAVLFSALSFLGKMPSGWGFLHIASAMLVITAMGIIVRGLLK